MGKGRTPIFWGGGWNPGGNYDKGQQFWYLFKYSYLIHLFAAAFNATLTEIFRHQDFYNSCRCFRGVMITLVKEFAISWSCYAHNHLLSFWLACGLIARLIKLYKFIQLWLCIHIAYSLPHLTSPHLTLP